MATLKFVRSYDEIGNIRTFVFEKSNLTWQPGQYQAYNLLQLGDDPEKNEHWFTIASAPSEGEIHISTRVTNSDFKQTLNSLQLGDTVETHDLEGDFTWNDEQPVVLVAGGIGVTPFRSMLVERDVEGQKIPATLLYYGRDDNFAFRGEFDAIAAKHPELTINYLPGQPITADSILETAPDAARCITYLSGPEPMVEAVGEALKAKGVNLKQDWFPGYDDKNY